MIEKTGKRIFYPLLFFILTTIIVFNVVRILSPDDKVSAYKVEDGWGYRISHNDKVYIDQSFIPLLEGRRAFPNKKSALKTGRLVLKRLKNRQLPVITFDDLHEMELDTVPETGDR